MPRIINTFAQENPLAKAIAGLGQTMFSDTLTPAVNKQKLRDAQREEMSAEEQARTFAAATDGKLDINRFGEYGILGGKMKPEDAAMWNVFLTGNKLGPPDPTHTNALTGAAKYENSAENLDLDRSNAFGMNEADNATIRSNNAADNVRAIQTNTADNAQDTYEFDNKPIDAMINGTPGFGRQIDVTKPGYQPIPTDSTKTPIQEFQEFIAAADVALPQGTPEQKRQWALEQISKSKNKFSVRTADGTVIESGDASSVGNVGTLTNANENKQQADLLAINQFGTTANTLDKILTESPHAVGASGNILHGVQSASILAKELAKATGFNSIEDAWAGTQAQALAMGVKPETMNFKYDPAFSEIETMYNIITFQGMRAIGGQSGNDQSNRDFQVMKDTLGDPKAWTTNAKDLKTKLRIVKDYVAIRRKQSREALGLPPEADPATGNKTSKGVPWKVVQ